jgi:hypothetical protein
MTSEEKLSSDAKVKKKQTAPTGDVLVKIFL